MQKKIKRAIGISSPLREKLPDLKLGLIECSVIYKEAYPDLLQLIQQKTQVIQSELLVEDIAKLPSNAATREAYKTLGKHPSRYRPSAEALLRRVVNGKGLYQVNNLVDLLNLVSITSGYSIGGWDAAKIDGAMVLGKGNPDEPYQAIGRGELNIENLPLFRDQQGAFGTPTSDSLRTMVTPDTKQFLMCFYAFDGNLLSLKLAMEQAISLLTQFADAEGLEEWVV